MTIPIESRQDVFASRQTNRSAKIDSHHLPIGKTRLFPNLARVSGGTGSMEVIDGETSNERMDAGLF
jgi:hypothetical protein